jgi:predicted RNase H-like HicB family nuclease
MKLNELSPECVEKHLNECLNFRKDGSTVYKRYSAYDYCFNYFRDFYANGKQNEIASEENMSTSCLQLGLYLATWGMYRGSSALHKRSFKIYEGLIERISENSYFWEIDVEDYCQERGKADSEVLQAIKDFKGKVVKLLSDDYNKITPYEKIYFKKNMEHQKLQVSEILFTKIMMGVFGCVPSYDSKFTKTLENKTLNKISLEEIYDFYTKNKEVLDKKQKEFKTLNVKGGFTEHTYKKAKIIDLIGFRVIQEEEAAGIK